MEIGKGALVGAGSVITKNVADDAIGSRATQKQIDDGAKAHRKRQIKRRPGYETYRFDCTASQHCSGKIVLVIGDVMLDKYVMGAVQRIYLSAYSCSFAFTNLSGNSGAANVARNLAQLGS